MGSTRAQVKELVKSTRDITPSKLTQLIDGLWRDPLLLYGETGLSYDDRNKVDPESEFYNPNYIYRKSKFRAPGYDLKTSWGVAIGFGHSVYADFSQVLGYGNESQSYYETILGPYATVAADCDACNWIETDRLLAVGKGKSSIERSDALTILKSGYSKFYNAIKIEGYSNLLVLPDDGSLQYTQANRFEGYWDLAWHKFVTTDANSYISLIDTPSTYGNIGCFPYMNTASTLGWSAYTLPVALPTENSVIVVTPAGVSSWQPYSGGGGGDAWLLGGNTLGQKDYLGSVDNYAIAFKTNDIERMSIGTDGLVNPLFNVRIENTTYANQVGIIYKGAVPWIHDFNYGNNGTITTEGHNIFIGEGAGNFTMGATATSTFHSSQNIGIGYSVLYENTTGTGNVAIGLESLKSNTTSSYNVAIGYRALYLNTTSSNNVAIGYRALTNNTSHSNLSIGYNSSLNNTSGTQNTVVGYQALYTNITGAGNIAFGYQALYSNTTHYNIAIGFCAMQNTTSGSRNTAVGYQALYKNITGAGNTAVGYQALYTNTASNLTAIGSYALYVNSSGTKNVAVGYAAASSNTTGIQNTAIGYEALGNNITAHNNTAVGYGSMYSLTTGGNTAVGVGTLYNTTVGEHHTALGYQALYTNTTGTKNTAIGYYALNKNTTGSYVVALGYESGMRYNSQYLTVVDQGVFIGASTKAKADNSTNEIVIGYNTIGNGSNTVTIGNTSITDNYLNGNLTIGNKLKILEGGATPTYYTIFQGGDQSADLTYTLPTAYPSVTGYVLSSTDAGVLSWVEMSAGGAGWELGGNTLGQKDYLGSVDNYAIAFKTNDIERMSIGTDGLVNPLFNVRLENTTHVAEIGIIYKGVVPFLHNFNYGSNGSITTAGGNTFVGENAGNLTMGATASSATEASYNTFVGAQVGVTNTTGYANVFVGYQAGYTNDTGSGNVFIGYQSGYYNESSGWANTFNGYQAGYTNYSGGSNTFNGYQAGYANSTGGFNTAVGMQAGKNNITGEENVFIGYQAGSHLADDITSLTIVNRSIYIGYDAKSKQNSQDNEIVIGYNAIGNGTNTVTIGNTSITDNYLTGNLQIGNKLKILEGGLTPSYYTIFQGGDQSADLTYTLPTALPAASGYVLSSTDAGVLSWVEMSSGGSCYWSENADGVYYSTGSVGIGMLPAAQNSLAITKTGTGHGIDVYSTGGAAGYFYATANHAVVGTTTNAGSFGGIFTGGLGLLSSTLSIGADTSNIAYTFPTVDGTAGQVLSTDGSGVLTWIANGSGSCNWTGITGGISYNSNVTIYDDGYSVFDNGITLSAYSHGISDPTSGTIQYSTSGRFAGRNGLLLFHDSYWQDLVEWDDNYLVNLIDVMTLGAPASDALLLVHSNRTVDWKLLSSFAWVADTYGINYTGGSVGIGTNSQSSYFMYVAGSGKTSIIQAYASDSSTAVDGLSQSGYGVKGQSNGGYAGVWGHSNSAAGVYGESNSGYGGVFAGLGVNISAGGLYIGGTNVINSSRVADFASIKIGGTERISSAGVFTPSNGQSGTWITTDGKTITALNGIITGIV